MSARRALSWLLLAALILPILASCKNDGDPLLTKELKSFSKSNDLTENTRKSAKDLLELQRNVQESLRSQPTLLALPSEGKVMSVAKSQSLHDNNQLETLQVLDSQTTSLNKLAENIKKLSKLKYSAGISREEIVENEALVLMNLLILRDLSQVTASKILFLMTKFDKPYFDELESNQEMKQRLLADYTTALAISAVSANDLKATLAQLQEMRSEGIVKPSVENMITKVVGHYGGAEKSKRAEVDEFLKQSITDKAQGTLSQAMKDYHDSLKGKTFLFDPALPDHPLVHVLVIVSNLSWGLVNTLVGLGFVITAAIVAPITMAAGATIRAFGYEPLFYEMRMPRLRIAENNMQIYADVCGLGYIPSKMSAGLFELDFCTGESFASDHEGGHAKQSALLGPLYFPAAILSYILNMGHGGFIEDWADEWAVS
ncbi:MAG: hypothetical protein K2P81_00270 [Bacteriovoracaceae bacterium]|nr:hypothetical protein [Bacteriovoracaceae bacterium]